MIYNNTKRVSVTPVVTAGAYSANDVVGGAIQFEVNSAGGGGVIEQILIVDDANQKAALDLYILRENLTTPIADNGAFASNPVIADLKNLVARVQVATGDYVTVNGNAYAIMGRQTPGTPTTPFAPLNIPYQIDKGYLWIYAVCTGTPTFAAVTDLTLIMTVWGD